MPRITRLSPDLANQIAAGEVVERPASVVKELVENAIDAEATRVAIEVELGGKRLIRVQDDGVGMAAEDAVLAIERHATSKIHSAEDLAAILTLGFRGEALPSIASVSRLTLRTRARGGDGGTEVRVHGGLTASVREIGAAEGTAIEVADLFYNLPARRKFLKSDAGETAQVSRIVSQLALAYPAIGFTLTSGGRRLLECPPAGDIASRLYQLYGDRPHLVPVRKSAGGLVIDGFVAALGEQGPVRGPQNVFVNRRIVKDRTIAHAIVAAYSEATIKERSPEAHLFLAIAPERVDVNVHPTKAEVRFLEPSLVHEVLRRALAEALGGGDLPVPAFALHPPPVSDVVARTPALPGVLSGMSVGSRWAVPASSTAVDGFAGAATGSGAAGVGVLAGAAAVAMVGALEATASGWPGVEADGVEPPPAVTPGQPVDAAARQAVIDGVRPMIPLGQFRDTYIVAVDADGILIIDQHVAHERVLFEQILDTLNAGRLASQRLLHPLVLELAAEQCAALDAHRADLDRLGFEIEEFGGRSVRIAAVPAIVLADDAEASVRALAEDLEGVDRGERLQNALGRIAATMACHAAVKANYPLTLEKMRYLLEELRRTAYSSVCPHGRPVVLRLSRREVEKNFQRI